MNEDSFFRIGSDKAGTVSLANLVSKNQSVFRRFNVLAPRANCFSLFDILMDKYNIYGLSGFKEWNAERRRRIEAFLEQLGRVETAKEDIFLSTETLWGRLSKRNLEPVRDQAIRLLHAITATFPDHRLKIILHVRRIDLYIESLYKQEIKAGRPTTLDAWQQLVTAKSAFYFFRILEEVFGAENIIVRPFERSQLHNGCVVEDMLCIMGLSERVEEFEIARGNEGLHRDLMETLIHMNQHYGKVTSNNHLLEISSQLEKEFGYEDVKNLLDRETREKLLAQYADFYSYLGQHYGDGSSFFKDPLPDNSHLAYELDPKREALIKKMVLDQADSTVEMVNVS